jgi:hypothetical protein
MIGSGTAALERPAAPTAAPAPPKTGSIPRKIAGLAVAVYGTGMLTAMVGTAVLSGDWLLTAIMLPQCLFAVLFGAGAMCGALLAPDPYVKAH